MVSGFGAGAAAFAAGCSGLGNLGGSKLEPEPDTTAALPPASGSEPGSNKTKIGLILPFSASGNAGAAAQSMRNAAEMAWADFSNPDVELIVKDDGGTAQG
ncbi:MAG: penicillin-binding protein activator, partial [Rhodoplanes sp.]